MTAGKLFHSGLPHKAVNPIELAMDAVAEMQRRFYQDFAPHPEEARCVHMHDIKSVYTINLSTGWQHIE